MKQQHLCKFCTRWKKRANICLRAFHCMSISNCSQTSCAAEHGRYVCKCLDLHSPAFSGSKVEIWKIVIDLVRKLSFARDGHYFISNNENFSLTSTTFP